MGDLVHVLDRRLHCLIVFQSIGNACWFERIFVHLVDPVYGYEKSKNTNFLHISLIPQP
jgi:hypothetical protein